MMTLIAIHLVLCFPHFVTNNWKKKLHILDSNHEVSESGCATVDPKGNRLRLKIPNSGEVALKNVTSADSEGCITVERTTGFSNEGVRFTREIGICYCHSNLCNAAISTELHAIFPILIILSVLSII